MSLNRQDSERLLKHLEQTSRTFAPGIALLRPELRESVAIAYLLCRILDSLEDESGLDASTRVELLKEAARTQIASDSSSMESWAKDVALLFADVSGDDAALCRDTEFVVRCFNACHAGHRSAIEVGFCEMASGMAEFLDRASRERGLRIRSFDELRRYCYYVAGTVGKILSRLFVETCGYSGGRAETLLAKDVAFGVGLQVVNILKGVNADAKRAAHFVPRELLDETSASIVSIIEDDSSDAARKVAEGLIREALENLKSARDYTLALAEEDRDLRRFCAFPVILALKTCHLALRSDNAFPEDNALRVPRPEVEALLGGIEEMIGTNAALGDAFAREFSILEGALSQ